MTNVRWPKVDHTLKELFGPDKHIMNTQQAKKGTTTVYDRKKSNTNFASILTMFGKFTNHWSVCELRSKDYHNLKQISVFSKFVNSDLYVLCVQIVTFRNMIREHYELCRDMPLEITCVVYKLTVYTCS